MCDLCFDELIALLLVLRVNVWWVLIEFGIAGVFVLFCDRLLVLDLRLFFVWYDVDLLLDLF